MLSCEFVRRFTAGDRRAERVARGRAGINVEHAERFVSSLHGHADDFADAVTNDALHGLEALIAHESAIRLMRLGGTDPYLEDIPRRREPAA